LSSRSPPPWRFHRAGANRFTVWFMALSLLFFYHGVVILGPVGMVFFFVSVYRWDRQRTRDMGSRRAPSTD
jgi:hypothetical protein